MAHIVAQRPGPADQRSRRGMLWCVLGRCSDGTVTPGGRASGFHRVAAAVLVAAAIGVADSAAGAAGVNPRPTTVPALRVWHGSRGVLRLARSPRVVLGGPDWISLVSPARVFAADLRRVLHHRVHITRGRVRPGDVVLKLGSADRHLGAEGYTMSIGTRVVIAARTPGGVFYGTRTLLQLLHQDRALPRGSVIDWPRYPDRGLMIDPGRRVYPARWIEREIRELAYLKMNILHLHLTDDQRWGIESRIHPEIVSKQALTETQVSQILAVASRYHVTVVPEIDMPGHLGALLAKHPELELKAAGGGSPPPQSPESRKLDITKPAALLMVHQLLDEYLDMFPGRYWDVGGDEYLSPADEPLYPQLKTYAQRRYGPSATDQDAIVGFLNWVDRIVRNHHKRLWAWHDELGSGAVVQANPDIEAGWWVQSSPLSDPHPPTPSQLLSEGHSILNDGWFPTYYTEDLGPIQGKPSMQKAYEHWNVNRFCGPTENDQFLSPCYVISPRAKRNLGSTINAWDNHELSLAQIRRGLAAPLMVLAQKTWSSPELTPSYAGFQRVMKAVGTAR